MMLVIREYWTDTTPHEHKSTVSYSNGGGWASRKEWEKGVRERHGFSGFDDLGRAIFKRRDEMPVIQYVSLEGS